MGFEKFALLYLGICRRRTFLRFEYIFPKIFLGLGAGRQCDQMARLFFNLWPVTAQKISSVYHKKFPKYVQNLAKCKIYNLNWQRNIKFCQKAKYRQIWSHCCTDERKLTETILGKIRYRSSQKISEIKIIWRQNFFANDGWKNKITLALRMLQQNTVLSKLVLPFKI